jgi:hypothetical protein
MHHLNDQPTSLRRSQAKRQVIAVMMMDSIERLTSKEKT